MRNSDVARHERARLRSFTISDVTVSLVKALAAAVILAAGVVPGLPSPIEAAEPKSEETLSVTYAAGLLTVYCVNTALDEVFKRVEASTGIRVVLKKPSARTCRRTGIEGQPLEWALDRLLTDHGLSYVLVLEPDDDIVAVRIFDGGQRVQRAPPSPARSVRRPLRRWLWLR
jgi:hypothetical protein